MLVRFVAAAIICLSVLVECLYVIDNFVHHLVISAWHCALLAIPFMLGIVTLFKAGAIAGWISGKLEE